MMRYPAIVLRTLLSLSIALLPPVFSAGEAAANVVAASVSASGASSAAGTAGAAVGSARIPQAGMPSVMPVLPAQFLLTPSFDITHAPSIELAPSQSVAVNASVPAPASVLQVKPVEAPHTAGALTLTGTYAPAVTGPGAMNLLRKALPEKSMRKTGGMELARSLDRLFDGMNGRRETPPNADGTVSAVAGRTLRHASGLTHTSPSASQKTEISMPAPGKRTAARGWKAAAVLAAALLMLAAPATAMAAGVPAAAAASLTFLTTIQPLATAGAAAAGVVYGLIASRRKDGEPAGAGEVMASALRYGVMAGAGLYVLMDLTLVLFLGLGAGLTPLPSALAAAALGQSAFQGKFTDPKTSSADRIIAVFPAVAAALGLSLGIQFLGPQLLASAVQAMAVTGVASALFAALYKPGKSPEGGPAAMARGYVLQTLMSGLALSVASPYLAIPFALMAAWGFTDVLTAVIREAAAHIPADWRRGGKA